VVKTWSPAAEQRAGHGILSAMTTGRHQKVEHQPGESLSLAQQAMSKVPEITVFFWIVKVLTTAMGEAGSDYLDHRFAPPLAAAMAGLALAVALALQFRAVRYVAWAYWLVVAMVGVFGTMAADGLHVELGLPYVVSTAFYAIVLAIVFATWYSSEKTLSIHSIRTRRREAFYWAAVIATFALGTAVGDLTATTLGLGYFSSGVMFAVLIAVPAVAHRRLGLNAIFAFWFAYIVTRPLGASFADWMDVPRDHGGLNMGTGPVALVLAAVIICFVGYLSVTRKDVPPTTGSPGNSPTERLTSR
jgi:uncharacterized membrane-anchored protein